MFLYSFIWKIFVTPRLQDHWISWRKHWDWWCQHLTSWTWKTQIEDYNHPSRSSLVCRFHENEFGSFEKIFRCSNLASTWTCTFKGKTYLHIYMFNNVSINKNSHCMHRYSLNKGKSFNMWVYRVFKKRTLKILSMFIYL